MNLSLRDLAPAERTAVQQRFDALAAKRFAPMPKKPRYEVWWPKAPLDARAFPEGIHPADGDDGFNESTRLMGFMNKVCSGEFFIANLTAPKPHFRHTGKLDVDLCRWLRTRLVSNPTCLLASNLDVMLIIDTQMRYSVLGGPPETIAAFERRFGGAEALQQTFSNYVGQMRMGGGLDGTRWAQEYLQKWSGWA